MVHIMCRQQSGGDDRLRSRQQGGIAGAGEGNDAPAGRAWDGVASVHGAQLDDNTAALERHTCQVPLKCQTVVSGA